MAAVSSIPNGRGLGNGVGLEENINTWKYARPTNPEHGGTSFSKPFSSTNHPSTQRGPESMPATKQQTTGSSKYGHAAAQHLNGHQEPTNDSEAHALVQTKDTNYLSPYKHGGSRPALADVSRSGSENDSIFDLYGHPISASESVERRERTPPQPALPQPDPLFTLEDEDPERSRWIHRDKLALIESHELQVAGIKLPRHSSLRGRSDSRSKGRKIHSRGPSRDLTASGGREQEQESLPTVDGKRQRTRSPQKKQQKEEVPQLNNAEFDLRTPEEIASDPFSSPMYRQQGQGLRSSSSRIPLPKSSPMPIPQEHRERHTPLPRTRGASGNWTSGDEDGIRYNHSRRRSQSVGSPILLDDGEPLNFGGTPNGIASDSSNQSPLVSPSTQRATGKVVPSNHARKASAALRNVSEPQKRPTSATARSSPATRPKSRSGLEPRPATAINRPEGEAPWLADMYKPDPRLPQDEQLIPTHAKRLQQKTLEEQTKADTSTPPNRRDFSPVAVHTQNGLQPPSPAVARSPRDLNEKSPAENQAGWPLNASPKLSVTKSNGSLGNNEGSNSPGGANDHAGYRTVPKVRSTPPIGSAPSPRPESQPMRREMEEKLKEKEHGCGCCVIM